MKEHRLRSVNWQGALKKRDIKQGFRVVCILCTRGSKSVVPKAHVGGQQKIWYYEKFMKL